MLCSFESDLDFIVIARSDFGVEFFKTFKIIGNGKRVVKYRAFKCADKTFVFITNQHLGKELWLESPQNRQAIGDFH